MRLWIALTAAVVIAGTTSSIVAANQVASRDATTARAAFAKNAAAIASTLQLAIQREEDLIFSAAALLAANPDATQAEFAQWGAVVQALERFPELIGVGEAVIVLRADLAAFAARINPATGFEVLPAGNRPYYCFSTSGFARTSSAFPVGHDFCAANGGNAGVAGLRARDSGTAAYLPFPDAHETLLVVLTPIYRGGIVPATVAARRAAFIGWVGTEIRPTVLLTRALQGHPGLAVSFTYAAGPSHATFASGAVPPGAHTVATSLHNGWTVRTHGAFDPVGVFSNRSALAVLLSGIAFTLLLGTLLVVLATGRVRALALVREKTDELRHQALHDSLTGLPNRALIMDRIEQLLARNVRTGKLGAALYMDLDGFKNVNDTLGHGAGDQLLQSVSARLTGSLRNADTIGRLAGDEFIVLLDDASAAGSPELVAERLLDVIRQPFHLTASSTPVVITASVGVAVGHRETPEELLREADMALYQAKGAGRNCYEVFHAELGASVRHRYELEFDLRSALDGDQFVLAYQAIYNLDDLSLVGVEALLRWEHPTLGRVEPDEFIPLLEVSGQIVDVGRWVLNEACTQMSNWRTRGSDLTISVNVSGRQLDRDVIVEHVREALATSGIEPKALILEVTEPALMRNVDATARRLHELKALGVQLAIDDFGTGYSSLAYLQRFPVDCLKIDRSFTAEISRSAESEALVRTLVQLGKDLGLKTLAEGVETPAQLDYLRTQNVDEIQGFLLAKPLTPDALESRIFEPDRSIVRLKDGSAH